MRYKNFQISLLEKNLAIWCKWIFNVKDKENGSIDRYKAHLFVKGFTQTYGIDYHETFAPDAKLNTVYVLLFLATRNE